jgi:4,5:9,10-diseco-3-hydroxy-5,9,17-trioxoandrosta-1(10),2-diene-4-oate hydrolase
MDTEQQLINSIGLPLKPRQVTINGFKINYLKTGSGPPALLIHGGNIGWGQWYPNVQSLSSHLTIYLLDLPGAGRSCPLNYAGLDLENNFVKTTRAFIDKFDLSSVTLIGSSTGGWIALRLALLMPDRIHKLILVDSLGFTDYLSLSDRIIGIYPLAQFLAKTVFYPARTNRNIEKLLRSVFFNPDLRLAPAFIDYFYETMQLSHNLLLISRLSSFWGMKKEFKMTPHLRRVCHHTLVIWGEHDKNMPPHKAAANLRLLPQADIRIMPRVGHIPSLENSREFNHLVIKFLKNTSSGL